MIACASGLALYFSWDRLVQSLTILQGCVRGIGLWRISIPIYSQIIEARRQPCLTPPRKGVDLFGPVVPPHGPRRVRELLALLGS